jgi:hypothetical protein
LKMPKINLVIIDLGSWSHSGLLVDGGRFDRSLIFIPHDFI